MKKTTVLVCILTLLFSCSAVKKAQTASQKGDYDTVISEAIEKLSKDKFAKRFQPLVLLLESNFKRAQASTINAIRNMEATARPEDLKSIYEAYITLTKRQTLIKSILPLRVVAQNREARFDFKDYSEEITAYRETLSEYIYQNVGALFDTGNKMNFRRAYQELVYLRSINPNYKNTDELQQIALDKGRDYVIVSLHNSTGKIIPSRLENDLLNFNTYSFNKLWTVYHGQPKGSTAYDFAVDLNFEMINISPERFRERIVERERTIKDGWRYEYDENGNVAKDTLGNDIKVDNFITVAADLLIVEQSKAVEVTARVDYRLLQNKNQVLRTYPLRSNYVFENVFATFKGDERALEKEDRRLIRRRRVPFPSNEQMVFDAGQNLKRKFSNRLERHTFR